MKRTLPALLAALLTALLMPFALAQEAETEGNRRTIEAIKGRLAQTPNDATLTYYLAAFQARVGDKADSIATLKKLAEIGEGFLPTEFIGFDKIWNDPDFKAVFATLEAKLPKVADAPLAFELDDKRFIPEGITWDPASKDFFVGSVAQKRIVRVTADGKLTPFSRDGDGLRHVLGLAVDPKRRLLHAISTSALTDAGRKEPVNAIVSWDIKSGRKFAETRIKAAQQLNDVAVAPNGDLYVSDSASGAIYMVRGGKVTDFLPAGNARGTNGLAVSADGQTVYAGHSTGIVRMNVKERVMERMPPPQGQGVAGIDGLYFHNGDLIGVQNVTTPARVIRIKLSPDGKEIKAVETLQSHHHPAFDEPTTGVVAGDAFYVLATTQVARFNAKGEIEKPESLKNPKVLRIPLNR